MRQQRRLIAAFTLAMCFGVGCFPQGGDEAGNDRMPPKNSTEEPSPNSPVQDGIPASIPVEEMYTFVHTLSASGTGMGGGHTFEGKGTGFFGTDYYAAANPWFEGVHPVGVKLVTIDKGTIITDVAIGPHAFKIRDRDDSHFRLQDP